MTTEDAIKILDLDGMSEGRYPEPVEPVDPSRELIYALCAQLKRENTQPRRMPGSCPNCNEHLAIYWSFCPECGRPTDWSDRTPLTLDELRSMVGEPVWVVCLDSTRRVPTGWRILDEDRGHVGIWDKVSYLPENEYGTAWLAYRHKRK